MIAETMYVPTIQDAVAAYGSEYFDNFTAEETSYIVYQAYQIDADGYAFKSALESFEKANAEIGGPGQVSDSTAVIDDDQIIVTVNIQGNDAPAQAEIVVSNDMFYRLESASLNKVSTMSDSMGKAAMNTLLGMGSVFIVLILISLIISCFNVIPKIQNAFAKKEANEPASAQAGIEKAVAQIAQQEESAEDDLELVAVIAAAIAASEGAASTDGFVVRSIRRRRTF
ncbi:MAG: OadG family protein [Lachnospiraceae bacterium]|nr:OadG family protein [Lachnospiraceae bacterium]